MGCWKAKELEERYSLSMDVKFLLCNACRKTHLTKTVIPTFERKARQSPATIDRAMQQRLRDRKSSGGEGALGRCSFEWRSTGLLDLSIDLWVIPSPLFS